MHIPLTLPFPSPSLFLPPSHSFSALSKSSQTPREDKDFFHGKHMSLTRLSQAYLRFKRIIKVYTEYPRVKLPDYTTNLFD